MHNKTTQQNDQKTRLVASEKATVVNSTDAKIDQDFPGFPHPPASEAMISPATRKEKLIANFHIKDGDKREVNEEVKKEPSADTDNID